MSNEGERKLALIGRIYDASVQPALWRNVLREIVEFVGDSKPYSSGRATAKEKGKPPGALRGLAPVSDQTPAELSAVLQNLATRPLNESQSARFQALEPHIQRALHVMSRLQ